MDNNLLAKDFSLTDTNGKVWRLSEHRGKVVTLLFYPGNETLMCTKQLCSVRDNWSRYVDSGAEVVAISPGNGTEQSEFGKHHNLPMKLLSDQERTITKIYGNHWLFPIWTTRTIVVVDAQGYIRYKDIMLRAFRPSDDEILAEIHLAHYDHLSETREPATII